MMGGPTNEPGSGPAAEDPAATRAARLARLRAATAAAVSPGAPRGPAAAPGAAAVLPFPRAAAAAARLTEPAPPEAPAPEAGGEAPAPAGDLDLLPGAGPGLVWALRRAGFACRADLAPLAPADLAARLGPLGTLAPVASWIAAARGRAS